MYQLDASPGMSPRSASYNGRRKSPLDNYVVECRRHDHGGSIKAKHLIRKVRININVTCSREKMLTSSSNWTVVRRV